MNRRSFNYTISNQQMLKKENEILQYLTFGYVCMYQQDFATPILPTPFLQLEIV